MQNITINLKEDVKDLQRLYQLSTKDLKTATARAMNRTITNARTTARRAAKTYYNVSFLTFTGTVNNGQPISKIQRARSGFLQSELDVNHKPMGLTDFNPTFSFNEGSSTRVKRDKGGVSLIEKSLKRKSRIYGKGVVVTITKGQQQILPHFFMLPGLKVVFGRGKYRLGPQYGWIQRNTRMAGPNGSDSVNKILSASIRQTVISNKSQVLIGAGVETFFPNRWKQEMLYVLFKGVKPDNWVYGD